VMLAKAGFDDEDFAVLANSDPDRVCNVTISEASIRYRSVDEKRQMLMDLANSPNPQIAGPKLLKALADIDQAATDDDRHMRQKLTKLVSNVLRGEEDWVPLPLGGDYNDWCLMYLRQAVVDKAALRDPAIQQRLIVAIQAQTQMGLQEAIASDPTLALQQAQQSMDQEAAMAQAQATQAEAQPQQAQPENVGQLMDMLSAAGQAA
jgi:hypothetical protein